MSKIPGQKYSGSGSMYEASAFAAIGTDTSMTESMRKGSSSEYIKLNVGGSLYYTTLATLTKQDSMLRAMFSGRMEVVPDPEGWIMIDRSGKHFDTVLSFLRDGNVVLPESKKEVQEILAEAKYYCVQGLIDHCNSWVEILQRSQEEPPVCRVPIISAIKEEKLLVSTASKPVIKLLLNRHNNKYSYTSQSDDNLLKNLELFDKLVQRFHERVLFIKDVGAANEVCSWTFFGHGRKVAEVCCTSIVYATDKKHTKVEFPEARIYEEAMNILLYEPANPSNSCPCCGILSGDGTPSVSSNQAGLSGSNEALDRSSCPPSPSRMSPSAGPAAVVAAPVAVAPLVQDEDGPSQPRDRSHTERLEKAKQRRGMRPLQ